MPYVNFNSAKPSVKLLIILFSVLTLGIIIFFIGLLVGRLIFWMSLGDVNNVLYGRYELLSDWQLKYFQAIQTLGFFIIPGLFLKWLFSSEKEAYFNTSGRPQLRNILLLVLLFFVGGPFINWLVEFNQNISLPDTFSKLESNLRSTENIYSQLAQRLLTANNPGVFLANVLLIAVLPAIGEELIFRGVFQKLFTEISRNAHVAIVITAVLFSAMHGQFFGFIPRMLLGILFGYLMLWSNTIWVPIIAHFINNALAVTTYYLSTNFDCNLRLETAGFQNSSMVLIIVSGLLVFASLYFIRQAKPIVQKI
jgi:uncharacterized protein